ncbi:MULTISPECIES: hypothetical protein [unclassified Bradyrhizobium]|uniref:hypothetical protein n=1 Tax=unclassified Bradyrhizobium TaxID=2631580 RepID=UPI002449B5B9|nr:MULTISPECIES: hypothetical protein [unclassified Bradyrhizobium]MDH2347690.1 hypothetical protein [Bradyrhizobium sp. SSUT77]MDH2352514.1 hypothetical protein [Bradyrhizobium sp. SSUT112]
MTRAAIRPGRNIRRRAAKARQCGICVKHDDLPDWNAAKFHTFRVDVNYHFDLLR